MSKFLKTETHFLQLCFYFSRYFWLKSCHTFFHLFQENLYQMNLTRSDKRKKKVCYTLVFCETFSLCSWSERTILNNPGFIKKKGEKFLKLSVWFYIQICESKEKHMAVTEKPQNGALKKISMKNKVPITKGWFTV